MLIVSAVDFLYCNHRSMYFVSGFYDAFRCSYMMAMAMHATLVNITFQTLYSGIFFTFLWTSLHKSVMYCGKFVIC